MTSFIEILAQYIADLLPWRIIMSYEWGVMWVLGREPKKLDHGFHICIPLYHRIEVVAKSVWVLSLPTQSIITRDGTTVVFGANIVIQVEDPVAHFCEVHDFSDATIDLAATHLAERVHALTYDKEKGVDLKELERSLKGTLDTRLRDWGTKVHKVGFTNFVPTEHQVRLFQDPHPLRTI